MLMFYNRRKMGLMFCIMHFLTKKVFPFLKYTLVMGPAGYPKPIRKMFLYFPPNFQSYWMIYLSFTASTAYPTLKNHPIWNFWGEMEKKTMFNLSSNPQYSMELPKPEYLVPEPDPSLVYTHSM